MLEPLRHHGGPNLIRDMEVELVTPAAYLALLCLTSALEGSHVCSIGHPAADDAAPIYCGQPGYGPHLGRDNDGVACE